MLRKPRPSAFLTAITAVVLGGLAFVVGVLNITGQQAENAALRATTLNYDPGFPLALVTPMFVLFTVGALGLLAIITQGFKRGVAMVVAAVCAVGLSQILKQNVLERPALLTFDFSEHNTFPSGHVTVFAVICFAAIFALPAAVRGFMSVCSVVLLCTVSAQVVLSGWHRPSDAFGALMLALACYALAAVVFPAESKQKPAGWLFSKPFFKLSIALCLIAFLILAAIAWFASAEQAALWCGISACWAAVIYSIKKTCELTFK